MRKLNYWVIPGVDKDVVKTLSTQDKIKYLINEFVENGYPDDLFVNKDRNRDKYSYPRHVIRYLLHKKYNVASTQLQGYSMGDHATILHSCKVVSNLLEVDSNFRERFDKFLNK